MTIELIISIICVTLYAAINEIRIGMLEYHLRESKKKLDLLTEKSEKI